MDLSLFVMLNEYSDREDEINRAQEYAERGLQDRAFNIILCRCVEGGLGSYGRISRRNEF